MAEVFSNFFSGTFIPHGHCFLWKPGLVWLHVVSDALIALAYAWIPIVLVYLVKQRGDIPFDWIFLLFGSFIVSCGITHGMDIWTLWHPDYWLSGFLKAVCATVSLTTGAVMVPLVPKVMMIPSPAQLRQTNLALQQEISDRILAEQELSQLTFELEQRVADRTAALAQANATLERENQERTLAQASLERTLGRLQQAQTQLVQAEKMSALGKMVAGIAHEFNNPVSFIYGNVSPAIDYSRDLLGLVKLYQQYYPEPVLEIEAEIEAIDLEFLAEDLPKLLGSMKNGAGRIRKIVKSMRTFSRLDEAQIKFVNIHDNIDSALLLLQYRFSKQARAIQVIKNYDRIPKVECYASELNQVFLQILTNAVDALAEVKETENKSLTIEISTALLESDRVQIRIADNGIGIKPETIYKIYDPFYTTKKVGAGTGLGLAVSYQIIQQHQGSLDCVSELGKGTELIIEIPLTLKQKQKNN
ncbi:MAG: sensor histidine kinase [Hormoscilla sp.]